jgi:hypothetical protein
MKELDPPFLVAHHLHEISKLHKNGTGIGNTCRKIPENIAMLHRRLSTSRGVAMHRDTSRTIVNNARAWYQAD